MAIAAVVLGLILVGNVVGWLSVRDLDRPWNWRALLGPVIYGHWIDRRP